MGSWLRRYELGILAKLVRFLGVGWADLAACWACGLGFGVCLDGLFGWLVGPLDWVLRSDGLVWRLVGPFLFGRRQAAIARWPE